MTRRFPIFVLTLACLFACQPTIVPPSLDEVEPNWGFNGDETPVHLNGANLFPGVDAKGGTIDGFDRDFMAYLAGPATSTLSSVRLNSEGNLSAIVPRGLPTGWYDLEVRTPSGATAELSQAFQVTDTRADHLRVTVDTDSHRVRDFAILRASIRDPNGNIVDEPTPISIYTEGGNNDTRMWVFDHGDIQDTVDRVDGRGFSGTMGPSGEVYFGFKSDEAGDFWVNVEAEIRERVTLRASALVRFQAGDVEGLAVTATEHSDTRRAGEPFDVDLRLVDAQGDTVSGVVATVVLNEACTGGEYQHVVTFVDDARVSVSPTKACSNNQILGYGVVEGQSISGSSQEFAVVGGTLRNLDVRVSPSSVMAGTEGVSVWIQGQDAWQNRVWEDIGEVELWIGDEPLTETEGSGAYTCAPISGGTASCAAGVFKTGEAVTLIARTTTGISGTGNPIVVQPGPAQELILRSTLSEAIAGEPMPLNLSALDRFGNRLPLTDAELLEAEFFDLHGPIDCDLIGPTPSEGIYDYSCILTAAGADNEIQGLVPSFGANGTYGPLVVRPGSVTNVSLEVDTLTASEGVLAGAPFVVELEGSDRFGNLAEGTTVVELDDIGSSISPTSVLLIDGRATEEFYAHVALRGNSVWAWVGDISVGASRSFDVNPGAAEQLTLSLREPWGFEEEDLQVEVSVTDMYGNPAVDETHDVTLVADTILYSDAIIEGRRVFEVPAPEAGVMSPIVVNSGSWTASTESIPIATHCADAEPILADFFGAELGRVCLAEDGTGETTIHAPEEVTEWVVLRDNLILEGPSPDSRTLAWAEPGATTIRVFTMNTALCGWVRSSTLYAGTDRMVTGEILTTSGADLLTAGTASSDSGTEVWVQARTCTGDLASDEEILIQPMLGQASTSPETYTPDGLSEVRLDELGEASFYWTMRDEAQGGSASIYVGSLAGSAFGERRVEVLGDAHPPTLWSILPSSADITSFDLLSLEFSEPMLDMPVAGEASPLVQVRSADGSSIEIVDHFWTDDQTVLNLSLADSLSPLEGAWSLEVSDDLRDVSGNRLDGDWDGMPGGSWASSVGGSTEMDAALSDCAASSGWVVTHGAVGGPTERTGINISAHASTPAPIWVLQIHDEEGAIAHRRESVRTGLSTGTINWDGRLPRGQTAPNGIYTAQLTPIDAYRHAGAPCFVSFVIDNALEPPVQ